LLHFLSQTGLKIETEFYPPDPSRSGRELKKRACNLALAPIKDQ
jgi:hypothetical protein